jgi:hypothetical protein
MKRFGLRIIQGVIQCTNFYGKAGSLYIQLDGTWKRFRSSGLLPNLCNDETLKYTDRGPAGR